MRGVLKNKRVYVDTSVFGGVFDPEFESVSKIFFQETRIGFYTPVISGVVRREIVKAPDPVRTLFDEVLNYAEVVDVTQDSMDLMQAYLKAEVVSPKYSEDALHVAIASICRCAMIVSWNFRHIVHSDKIRLYHSVNMMYGYPLIDIYSPLEVIHYDENV